MNQTFIDILQKLIAEQGKEAFLNPARCKAFLADYTHGEYKKESRFLLQALEAGAAKEIDAADDVAICKKQQVRLLHEEYGMDEKVAADTVDTLALALRGEVKEKTLCKKCGKELSDEWKVCPYCSTSAVDQESAPEIPAVAQAKPPQEETPPEPEKAGFTARFLAPLMEEETALPPLPVKKKHIKKKHTKRNVLIAIAAGVVLLVLLYIFNRKPEYQVQIIAYGTAVEITGYTGSKTDIQIPSHIENLPVTAIGGNAFRSRQLKSVNIPDSVTTIGNWAFMRNQLTSITIPGSVTTIGNQAFADNKLTSITIPNSVIYIGNEAFSENRLTSVLIPDSVITIGNSAFKHNQLISVTIPNGVTRIENGAFSQNQLTSVTIPNSVTSIGAFAFSYNQLTSIIIPNKVNTIGNEAFSNNQLTSVTIPNSVHDIGWAAFYGNRLTSISVPNRVYIADKAFDSNVTITRRRN